MAFIADTQSALSDYREGVEASDAKFNKEKAYYEQRLKNYNINREAFAALMEKPTANHNAELKTLRETATERVTKALNDYLAGLDRRYLRTADSIDQADVALLGNDVVELSAQDVENMFSKHDGNQVMQGIIADYDLKHETGANITFYCKETRATAAKSYASGCMSVLQPGKSLAFSMYETGRGVPPELSGE